MVPAASAWLSDATAWVQFGIALLTLAGAAVTVVRKVRDRRDDKDEE
ncbi:membrane protein implicated in regulation of membrane protease activity [Actinoplanes octamycinicus]|uniref:Membrane protein implicated in regulation of membrane protease activity n=1 Tax=Actinoplanes octamycinicus TaxID=135948 RepID=A0A7W7H6H1_9ACTN|nr:hypothetical protein [Actinoplanes octamycinicus]MBB4744906.1 membrane protein implicated in regulation of membrane protease activity [Actinoplanes octamycinicus]GIE55492.1 hypothetical protein Aoc01nite_08940 [Actinoplanes octamycinicus]